MKPTDPIFPTPMQCMGLNLRTHIAIELMKAIMGREGIGSRPYKFIVAEAVQATEALLKELE